MMKKWKFINEKDLLYEKVLGRNHFWHFHPEIIKDAGIYMVKVHVPVGGGHDFHRHPGMNEILYIIKGTAEQWVEDEMQILEEGDSVYIDADVVHASFNAANEELQLLAILSPSDGWEAGTIDVYNEKPYSTYRNHESKRI